MIRGKRDTYTYTQRQTYVHTPIYTRTCTHTHISQFTTRSSQLIRESDKRRMRGRDSRGRNRGYRESRRRK